MTDIWSSNELCIWTGNTGSNSILPKGGGGLGLRGYDWEKQNNEQPRQQPVLLNDLTEKNYIFVNIWLFLINKEMPVD